MSDHSGASSPTALLVDDEENLSRHLAEKLAHLWPELKIVGTAINGRQALAQFAATQPDIVFLDINMPGLSGLEVARALDDTRIVFVTAYDQFAIDAFNQAAVDYLLKPVEDARLQQTIQRLQALDRTPVDQSRLEALLEKIARPNNEHLRWLRTGLDDVTELVPVDDVVYFKAEAKYTSVFTRTAEHLLRMSIKELAERLDGNAFWQIHRGLIVRVDQVASARRDLRGRYTLTLRDRPETLRTSQAYGHLFKHM